MNIPLLKLDYSKKSEPQFLEFWSKFYIDAKAENFYTDTIDNPQFSDEDIRSLFEWKNGMKFNEHVQKEASLKNVISKLDVVNQLKLNFDMNVFNSNFSEMSPIWKVFLLHVIQPSRYPIFDQHVYRAHVFITNREIKEIRESRTFKEDYYFNIYLPYYNTLIPHASDSRMIDKALWSFGKFLKTLYASKLIIEGEEEEGAKPDEWVTDGLVIDGRLTSLL